MKYSEVIDSIQSKLNFDITEKEIDNVLDAFRETCEEELAQEGGEVPIPKLGKFKRKIRGARTGRNPKTGEEIQIAEKAYAKFDMAKALKEKLN